MDDEQRSREPDYLLRAKNHPAHFVDATLLGNDTQLIPLIEFQDVPLAVALMNLARQANFKCTVELQPADEPTGAPEPVISFRSEHITAKEAFITLCENYDLVVIKDPNTGVVEVKPTN